MRGAWVLDGGTKGGGEGGWQPKRWRAREGEAEGEVLTLNSVRALA